MKSLAYLMHLLCSPADILRIKYGCHIKLVLLFRHTYLNCHDILNISSTPRVVSLKVCGPCAVTLLSWTPIFGWYYGKTCK